MAKEKRSFVVSVLSEKETIYYGDCTALTVPTERDTITVLPYHTPLIAKLGKGQVVLYDGHKGQMLSEIDSGLIYVGDNEVTVLVNL